MLGYYEDELERFEEELKELGVKHAKACEELASSKKKMTYSLANFAHNYCMYPTSHKKQYLKFSPEDQKKVANYCSNITAKEVALYNIKKKELERKKFIENASEELNKSTTKCDSSSGLHRRHALSQ
jgi:hypothetical protein